MILRQTEWKTGLERKREINRKKRKEWKKVCKIERERENERERERERKRERRKREWK